MLFTPTFIEGPHVTVYIDSFCCPEVSFLPASRLRVESQTLVQSPWSGTWDGIFRVPGQPVATYRFDIKSMISRVIQTSTRSLIPRGTQSTVSFGLTDGDAHGMAI